MDSGNLGRFRSLPYHLLSVRPHYPISTFGALEFLAFYVTDASAYLILFIRARRELRPKFPGITDIWGVILRDGTVYFMVIFFVQFCALVLPYITSVGDI